MGKTGDFRSAMQCAPITSTFFTAALFAASKPKKSKKGSRMFLWDVPLGCSRSQNLENLCCALSWYVLVVR